MMKNFLPIPLAVAFGISLSACSNSEESDKGEHLDSGAGGSAGAAGSATGGSGGDIHHESGGTAGTTGSGGTGGMMMDGSMMMDGGVHAPIMETVEPMEGGLHVMWMNVTADCDQIQLLRNKDGGAYAVAYTLTGTAMSQHDTEATSPGTYCYKAVCVKDSMMSAESNEMCGTP